MFINPPTENCDVHKITWKNTECAVSFPLAQWLLERATTLRYTYIANLVTSLRF